MRNILGAAILAALSLSPLVATAQVSGSAKATVEGKTIKVYTYKPGCTAKGTLFVFHGNERTASSYRDSAKPLADRECLAIYAPLFDEARFPSSQYHRGGVTANGPTEGRTVDLVDDLMAWAHEREGRPNTPVYLFGHSAGGQFLSRVAAYAVPAAAARIIVANPSTWVLPNGTEDAPYGFDMKTDDVLDPAEEALLRAYLAAPVTVFLGLEDTGSVDLTMGAFAERQGVNRLDRGLKTFDAALRMAESRGWVFNWRLVTANGIGHSGGKMMRSPQMLDAMGPNPVLLSAPGS